jgi:trans-aconitate methyltransferase
MAPSDRLLKIGCGQGVGVSLICERLSAGSITVIDRARAMIEQARRRNRDRPGGVLDADDPAGFSAADAPLGADAATLASEAVRALFHPRPELDG